jgi:tripartite-type tricarboxylate transporter receptor subunit TctC
VKARIAEPGSVPLVLGSAAFAAFLAAETAKWAKVVKYAGVKPS